MVDAFSALVPSGGIGRYVRAICDALQWRPDAVPWRLVYPRSVRGRGRARYPNAPRREIPLAWWQLRMLMVAGAHLNWRFDRMYGEPAVVHSPLGYGPRFKSARLIATIHDLTFLEHPEWHPRRTTFFLGNTVPAALRDATTVVCDSEHVRHKVIRQLRVPAARTLTLAPPLGEAFRTLPEDEARLRVSSRWGLDGAFILHVGTIEPRKNHMRLVDAFERMRRAGYRGALVLAGQDGWHTRSIRARLERSPERSAILRVRDADDQDLTALYNACTLCAFPSIEEGFGYPVLESMACGTPCVTSDHAALVELGQGYAYAVPAHDAEALAQTMLAVWRDPQARARALATGPARAAAYRFEVFAERLLSLYRAELAATPGAP